MHWRVLVLCGPWRLAALDRWLYSQWRLWKDPIASYMCVLFNDRWNSLDSDLTQTERTLHLKQQKCEMTIKTSFNLCEKTGQLTVVLNVVLWVWLANTTQHTWGGFQPCLRSAGHIWQNELYLLSAELVCCGWNWKYCCVNRAEFNYAFP